MWLGLQTVSSLERWPLFRMSFIERFRCTQTAVHYTNCHPWLNYMHTYVCMYLCHCVCSNSPLLWHAQPQPQPHPPHIPISLDVGTGPNIILCGQDKLVVQDPLRFVVQAGRRMQLHNLQVAMVTVTGALHCNKGHIRMYVYDTTFHFSTRKSLPCRYACTYVLH